MIVTDINHIEHQVSKTAFFNKAIEFLRRPDIHNMSDGRVDIDGQQVFALVQRYETVKTDAPRFEYHRKYIDIQYIASGKEIICWAPVERMAVTEEYDIEKDICFGYAILHPMNILVTGAAGFIGSNLTDKLLEKNEKVIAIDDFNDFYVPDIKEENLKEAIKNPNFKLYRGDIRDKALINKTFKENSIDVVCHIAARAGVRPSLQDPILYEEVNCLGTLNLLEAVKKHPVKNFVFASSSSVYGINSKVPFSEEDPISQPISPYA